MAQADFHVLLIRNCCRQSELCIVSVFKASVYILDVGGYVVGEYQGQYYPLAMAMDYGADANGWAEILVWNKRTFRKNLCGCPLNTLEQEFHPVAEFGSDARIRGVSNAGGADGIWSRRIPKPSECVSRRRQTLDPVRRQEAADGATCPARLNWLLHASRRNTGISVPERDRAFIDYHQDGDWLHLHSRQFTFTFLAARSTATDTNEDSVQ